MRYGLPYKDSNNAIAKRVVTQLPKAVCWTNKESEDEENAELV